MAESHQGPPLVSRHCVLSSLGRLALMSSLNPFAARRERKEEQMRAKIEQIQDQRSQMTQGGQLQPGELSGATAASINSLTMPESSYDADELDKYLPSSARVDQPPPSWSGGRSTPTYYEPPSRMRQCVHKLQNGFMIGAALGGAVGFLCTRGRETNAPASARHTRLPNTHTVGPSLMV